MAVLARRVLPCDAAVVWAVLSEVAQWPSWVASIEAVTVEDTVADEAVADDPGHGSEGGQTGYRIDQPPLPSTLWSLTRWEDGAGFEWQSQGAAMLISERFDLDEGPEGTIVSIDVTWSGRTAWFARAAYGPVRQRYAVAQLEALSRCCLGAI